MAKHADYRLGIDLGGTKILVVVLEDGKVVSTAKASTNAAEGYQAVIERIALLAKTARKKVGVKRKHLRCVGVGVPGPVLDNTLLQAPNLGWHRPNLAADLSELLGISTVHLANDVNCGTLGEATVGAGGGAASVFGLFVGTGLGGGWVKDRQVHEGQHGFAGEVGHIRVPGQFAPCGCGQTGCLETLVSKRGLARMLRESIAAGYSCALTNLDNMRSSELQAAYDGGCPTTVQAVRTLGQYLGWAVTTIATVLDPALFVLGGGVVERLGPHLLADIEAARQQSSFVQAHTAFEVRLGSLGGEAVAIGAAQLGY
jgi:glucokinase